MLGLFGCKHPFESLVVEKDATVAPFDDDIDYEVVTYHFYCLKCRKPIDKKYGRYRDQKWRLELTRKHSFWRAGEEHCPKDILASNGELVSLRCRYCGEDSNDVPCVS